MICWPCTDHFRFCPISGHSQSPSACLKSANRRIAPGLYERGSRLGQFRKHSYAGYLSVIVIVIAIYEIVARERDCRWISPDFI